ncbi:helix-turn-helix transcriptional regulator [Nitriliruptoraceae bacterium ZYF776]|nr:helix-turn-helix transcriptional regulator [Profundirhabdus halotolerans]
MSVTEELLARAEEAAGDETSRRILAAAVERFSLFGIRRTTMDDVAAAAGIGRATLYRRFSGRDEIVRAVNRGGFCRERHVWFPAPTRSGWC